jgi:outer membrane receptor protein involved in Fe transport
MRSRAGEPWVERVGYFDGPLSWRGNIGAEWGRGPLSIDLNLQLFGRHRVTYADLSSFAAVVIGNEQVLRFQGSAYIPAQAYVDLGVRRRFGMGAANTVDVRFGIQNLLDKRPPIVANPGEVSYSTYGDARRRRFELAVSTEF